MRSCGDNSVVEYQLPKLIARVRFPFPAFILLFVFLAGCATTEYKPLPQQPSVPEVPAKKEEGVYHKVAKGQTLWRIAKSYGVSVEDIIRSNNIPNVAAIEVGQLVFIPGVKAVLDITERTPDENQQEFAWPLRGKVVVYFNDRRGNAASRGVDIETAEGSPVKASRAGTVVMADHMAGYGQTLMIDHGDGFVTVYAQNRKLLSKLGEHVYKGDPIAESGRTGRKTFVHFELRKAGTAVNPLYYLP